MKATIDVPDDLYRRVKAKSALDGRAIREVTIELYQRWLSEPPTHSHPVTAEQWLDEWTRLGEETMAAVTKGPSATEILTADRDRLEDS